MSDSIQCRGELLGWIHSLTEGINKSYFLLEMNGIEALEKLCRQADSEPVKVEGMPPMDYKTFKREILGRTRGIYLSTEAYLADLHKRE